MESIHYLIHVLAILLCILLLRIFLQMAYAAWGNKRAKENWIVMVNTPYFQIIGAKWLSAVLVGGTAFQLILLIVLLGISIYLGKPVIAGR